MQAIELRDYTQLLQVYRELPEIDFSRHIATGQEQRFAVMPVPRCGWSDLGTPQRLARTVARGQKEIPDQTTSARQMLNGCVNLTERLTTLMT